MLSRNCHYLFLANPKCNFKNSGIHMTKVRNAATFDFTQKLSAELFLVFGAFLDISKIYSNWKILIYQTHAKTGAQCIYTLRKRVLPSTYFWCFSLSQIEDSIQYLEGPKGMWRDHFRHIGFQMDRRYAL